MVGCFLASLRSTERPLSSGLLQLLCAGAALHCGAWALGRVGPESRHPGLAARSVRDLPDQGLNLCPLCWQADSQPLGQGKSTEYQFYLLLELGVVWEQRKGLPLWNNPSENVSTGSEWLRYQISHHYPSSFVPLCSLSSLLVTGGRWAALSHYSFPFLEFNINGNPLMCVLFCNCSTFPEYSVLFPLCIFILEEREKEWGRERKKCMCVYSASLVPLLSPSSSVHGQHSSFLIVILILILWFAFVEFPSLSLHSPSVPVRCPLLPFEPLAY